MGISGGGLVGFFSACLDERVSVACVSGYFNTFDESVLKVPHCLDNVFPGMRLLGEMPELAALIAPRRLAVENGSEDNIFPVGPFRDAVETARRHWSDPARLTADVFEGEHSFNGRSFWPKMAREGQGK